MGSYDIFHEAADRTSVARTYTTGVITSGPTTLQPEGATFTLASAPSTPFVEGQRVVIAGGGGGVHCIVKRVASSTSLTLLPMQSVLDSSPLPHSFPDGSVIAVTDEVAAQQVIDLSDAPNDSYDFLLVANATIETSGTPADVIPSLRLGAMQDDPYSGVGGFGECRMTLTAANPDRANFVAASKLSLLGGQRYENYLSFTGTATNGLITTVSNPRLLALRVTGGYFAGDGKTSEQTTTTTPAFTDYLDLGANLPAGQYLIVSTWALGSASGISSECILEADGSTVLANQITTPVGASNYIPGGFFGVVTLGATNRVRLRYRSILGFTCRIKNAFLAAIPIANIPALAAAQVSQDLSTDVSTSIGPSFTSVKTSDSVTLESGRHIEIVSASLGGEAAFRARPNFGGAGTGLGNDNLPPFGTTAVTYHSTFWFIRNRRSAGATTNAVQMRSQSGSNTLRARDFTFSWLRERADFVAQPDEPIAVIADVELGGRVLKRWNSTTTSRRYVHRIDDQRAFSRVRVNGQEYTRVYSTSALADGTWFWDATGLDLYVQLTTTHDAIGAPDHAGVNIVVVPLLLAGREKHDLIDALGTRWPYRPLIESVPKVSQTLDSDDAKFAASASLGSLEIAAAHGEFDDKLFRSSFESYRVKIRRGFPRQSKRLDDFEVVADAIIRNVSTDFETMRLQLLDRRRLLQTPVANTKITVREGFGTDARSREDQELPVVWGETLGLPAYRITANEGGSDWNEYRYCDHAVSAVNAVWIDTERRKAVSSGNKNVTATYTVDGRVRVNNAAFDEPTQPPDVVYVDVLGRTNDGTTSGTALQKPGEIARDLLVTHGGTPAVRLIEKTFRMVDRRLRWQQVDGVGRRPVAPRISFVVSGKTTVEEALTKLCGETALWWYINHQDRIGLDVPDLDRGNQARNGGFEDDSATAYPWQAINGATLSLTTSRKFAGARSAEISNGSTPNAQAAAVEHLTLPYGGTWVVTLVASLLEGEPAAFRIGMVGPSGDEQLTAPQTLNTGRWSRHSLVYNAEPGDAGFAELRLYPAHGSTTATRIAVDEVHVYRVACVTDRVRSVPVSLEFEDEHYFECATPYAVNRQISQNSKRVVGESEARGLSAALEPEGKFAVQSSTRAELSETHAADRESAGGLSAPVALYYSRPRAVLTIDVEGIDRIPLVGEYVFHRDNPRIPESADEFPIWRISKVETDDASAKVVRLEVKRQIDPVADRIDIAPDSIPMGGIVLSRSSSAMPDFAEVTALQNQFIKGARNPDTTTQRGNLYHVHPLSHTHPVPAHQHTVTLASHGIDKAGPAGKAWPIENVGDYEYPGPLGPQAPVPSTRGLSDGGHNHGASGAASAASASGTSSAPNSTIESAPGPIEPSYRRVRFMQRIGAEETLIDQNTIVGIRSASVPAGWTRVTELDGYFIRGATSNGAVSTTVATSAFTPNDSGSTLIVASASNISVGKRLRVRNTADSNKQVHVVVIAMVGTSLTVVPLHETTDEPNTYSFPAGATSTVVGDSEAVDTTFTAPTHKHGGTMPSHNHSAGGHVHAAGAAAFQLGAAGQSVLAQKYLGGASETIRLAAQDGHSHSVFVPLPQSNAVSGAAAGTLADDVTPMPPYYELVFIKPADGNQRTLPAGAIIFWSQSSTPPHGYARIGAAKDLLIKGAPSSQGPGQGTGGHVHTQSNAAHTLSHNHGGTVIIDSAGPASFELIEARAGASEISVAAGEQGVDGGHVHAVTASVSSTNPGLSSNSHATGAPSATLPLHKNLVLIQKQ